MDYVRRQTNRKLGLDEMDNICAVFREVNKLVTDRNERLSGAAMLRSEFVARNLAFGWDDLSISQATDDFPDESFCDQSLEFYYRGYLAALGV